MKFNAWNKETKTMHIDILNPDNWSFSFLNQDIFTWLQFTGLKDKSGKEIYKGDIVSGNWWSSYTYKGEIKFGITTDLHYDFYGWFVEYIDHNKHVSNQTIEDICKEFQRIGNVYQHPELLK